MKSRRTTLRRAVPGLLVVALAGQVTHRTRNLTLKPCAPPPRPSSPSPRAGLAPSLAPTSSAPSRRAPTNARDSQLPRASVGFEHVPGQALLVAEPGQLDTALRAAELTLGARSLGRVGADDVARVALPAGTDLAAALPALRSLPGVLSASPDAVSRGASWPDQGILARVQPSTLWNLTASRWSPGRVEGVTIAVLDSGLALRDHVDEHGTARARAPWLEGVRVVSPRDTLHDDDLPDDTSNHGTHLASMLVGFPGMARGADLMPVQVLDGALRGTESALISGLDWARTHGARVVNLSLAFGRGYHPSVALDRAVSRALASGLVLVAAAGNGGDDDVRFPAAFPGVLAVGAGTLDGPATAPLARARYASTGWALDVLAPGGDLARDDNRDGVPDGIVGISFDPERPTRFAPWLFAGSSQAAAHGTAAAARLLAEGVPASEVIVRIRTNARPLSRGRGFDADTGAGALDQTAMFRPARAPEPRAVQVLGALVRQGASVGVTGAVAVVDHDGEPRPNARVLARWRGALDRAEECTTDRAGVCYLQGGALPDGAPRVALLEVQGIVERNGALVRPDQAFWYEQELVPASHAAEASQASALLLWRLRRGSAVLPRVQHLDTVLVRGVASESALSPSVVILDEASLALALGDPTGTGFGRSSLELQWLWYDPRWFAGVEGSLWLAGAGFGRSSVPPLAFTGDLAWGDWGAWSALASVTYAPGWLVGAAQDARAASQARLEGQGEGIPLP